jgi:transcriptional regulator with XRE-family HTH domain
MDLDTKVIGERIKQRRNDLHLTQTDIREQTGISSGNMSDIERGNRLPAAGTLIQLSKALHCSIDYILTGESPDKENTIISHSGENSTEKMLIEQFRGLSEDDQEEIMMMVQLKYNRTQKTREKEQKSSPSGSRTATGEIA